MLSTPIQPDYEALLANLKRQGTPKRVHYLELFLDGEIKEAISERFGLSAEVPEDDPHRRWKLEIELQRFLGYDYVASGVTGVAFPRELLPTDDTTQQQGQRRNQRNWTDEHTGPIAGWQEFEQYPWPDPAKADTSINRVDRGKWKLVINTSTIRNSHPGSMNRSA